MLLAVQNLPRANLDLPNATFATFTGNATSFQLFSFWYHTIFRLLYRYLLATLHLPKAVLTSPHATLPPLCYPLATLLLPGAN